MPGFYDENDDFEDESGSSPKDLRAALAKANKALKAKEAELAERDTQLADLAKKVKTVTLRDALSAAGVDPKYARFAERDEVDATPEAIAAWVDENKEVYAFLGKPAATATDDDEAQETEDEIDPDLAAGVLAGQQVEGTGRPSGSTNLIQQLEGIDTKSVQTREELEKLLAGMGVPLV